MKVKVLGWLITVIIFQNELCFVAGTLQKQGPVSCQ